MVLPAMATITAPTKENTSGSGHHAAILLKYLTERQRKNSSYSLRAFARHLGTSPGQLSSLMSGKKNLTPNQAVKFIERLELGEFESIQLLKGLHPKLQNLGSENSETRQLTEDEFRLISDWYHLAILSLSHLKDNQASPKWIAEKIGIDISIARDAVLRLTRLGVLSVKDGRLEQTTKPLTTTKDIPSAAIRKYHKQNLEIAALKLESIPPAEREFSTITMAIQPNRLRIAKKMINEFKLKLCDELESKSATEVYTLAIQLFPITTKNSDE